MKKLSLLFAFVVLVAGGITVNAQASSPLILTGKWAGPAFANPALDIDGDGVPGRFVVAPVYNQVRFTQIEGAVDSHLVAFPGQPGNTCPNPAAEFEIEPLGNLLFRGLQDGALYATIDNTHHLCFNPAAPNEVLYFNITGGTGIYAGRTGTGSATLNDRTLLGAGPLNVPLFVDTRGTFTLTLN